ncbi:unnamed protein product [Moneuplotes crassus]|uniref:Uncharacterized protein n=1 Tax=Euplotes crassus TaxID=5936 RepID=A0AAD1Y3H6_EUPCR|nr:unnamed protein product [Moneuplotes crassus]
MELKFLQNTCEDKTFVNPAKPEETFTCTDLMNDYKLCKRQRRMAEYDPKAQVARCFEFRKLSVKCFWYDDDQFNNVLLDLYEEKKKYVQYLVDEGSVIAEDYLSKNDVFDIRENSLFKDIQ